jgi:LmbE family N-acetylglucosaminyl deacetylase
LKASRVLGATPVFAGQIDGSSEITNAHCEAFEKLLDGQQPDVVFTHWPVDTHRDHCAASLLTFQAWYRDGKKYPLVYFEVMGGEQTQQFAPNFYVDVTEHGKRKKKLASCTPAKSRLNSMPITSRWSAFRGLEYRCKRAEAFVVHSQGPLPPVVW